MPAVTITDFPSVTLVTLGGLNEVTLVTIPQTGVDQVSFCAVTTDGILVFPHIVADEGVAQGDAIGAYAQEDLTAGTYYPYRTKSNRPNLTTWGLAGAAGAVVKVTLNGGVAL